MKFRKTLNRRINEDFENLEAFFDAVKKEFRSDYTVRTSGIPNFGAIIILIPNLEKSPFIPNEIYVNLETDPTNIKDFSECIELRLNFNYDLKSEKLMLKKLRGIIDDISSRLTDCLEQI